MSLLVPTVDLLSQLVDGAVPLVVSLADEPPADEDVKAGWTAFALFLLGVAAVALLGWSLTKQLKKAKAAADAGLFAPSDRPSRRTSLPGPDESAEERPEERPER